MLRVADIVALPFEPPELFGKCLAVLEEHWVEQDP